MDVLSNAKPDFTIMKEPRGFLRLIQLLLAIFAFATICTSATAKVQVDCGQNKTGLSKTVEIKYSYPFDLSHFSLPPFCGMAGGLQMPFTNLSYAPAAQFFCFVGVMSFLLCIAYCIGYILFSGLFVNDSRAATIDFIFSVVWTALWFIASTAWADRLNSMGQGFAPSSLIADLDILPLFCSPKSVICTPGEGGSHATFVVSVLFGYLNMMVWGAGLWFLFKETRWHQEPAGDVERFDQPGASGGAAGGSSYQASDPNDAPPTY